MAMRNLMLGTALACAATATASASAKQPLSPTPDDLSVQAVHNFAACIVDTTPKGAIDVLGLDYRTAEYKKDMTRLTKGHADGRCMTASVMRSNDVLIAGGMAERLLIEKVNPARFPSLVAYDAAAAPIEARSPAELTSICVVRAEPARTWAIFKTDPTSPDESHAMQAIGSTLLNCVKAGQKMSFNKPGLRAMLALAAYRLTQPAPIAAASARPVTENPGNQ
jgi:hypothetical protein